MFDDLLYPNSSSIAKFSSRFERTIRGIFLITLLSLYPFVITHLTWEPFGNVDELSGELNYNPVLSSFGNGTSYINYNENVFDFEVVAQRVWNGSDYGQLTVPLFFTNDNLNRPRNITFLYYWIVQQNLTLKGDSGDIQFYIPSFGSGSTIITHAYLECGSSIDIYVLLNSENNEFFVSTLDNIIYCWG